MNGQLIDNETTSQEERILEALENGEKLTPMDALRRWGCFRLGARIFGLKSRGHNIETKMIGNGRKRYAEYRLIPKDTLF